jgi:nucleotide-binding universal stress UspA family protein
MGEPRIVVGIDGSRASFAALHVAVEEAKLRQVSLHIVVAWQLSSPDIAVETPQVVHHIVRHNEQILEAALNEIGDYDSARVFVSGELVNGPPVATLLAAAEGSALLVVGSCGTSDRAEPYLGSVAHEVLHHAPCPVLLVPAPRG